MKGEKMEEKTNGLTLFRSPSEAGGGTKVVLEIGQQGEELSRVETGIRPDMTRCFFKGCAQARTRRDERGNLVISVPTEKDAQGVLDVALGYEWGKGNDYY